MMPRYLDEEKIKHTVNEYIDRTGSDVFTREHIFDFLFETDSADVQEVKHGKWVKSVGTMYCSKCAEKNRARIRSLPIFLPYFCEDCGARMDGDKR